MCIHAGLDDECLQCGNTCVCVAQAASTKNGLSSRSGAAAGCPAVQWHECVWEQRASLWERVEEHEVGDTEHVLFEDREVGVTEKTLCEDPDGERGPEGVDLVFGEASQQAARLQFRLDTALARCKFYKAKLKGLEFEEHVH